MVSLKFIIIDILKSVILGVKRKIQVLDIKQPDLDTSNYVNNLTREFPHYNDLVRYVNQHVITKIPVNVDNFDEDFADFMVLSNDSNCDSLIEAFFRFFNHPINETANHDELELVGSINDSLLSILVILKQFSRRNSSSVTTESKRPDFLLNIGPKNIPILVGEEKIENNGDDPVNDLQQKVPQANWEMFYGNLEYFFAYSCVGGRDHVNMQFGVINRNCKFQPLICSDLNNIKERIQFITKLVRLYPIILGVADTILKMNNIWSFEKSSTLLGLTKSFTVVVFNPTDIGFQKKWNFLDKSFQNELLIKLNKIYDILKNNNDFIQLRQGELVHMKSDGSIAANFVPYGTSIQLLNVNDSLKCILSVCNHLLFLHNNQIIHNDLRLDNIIELNKKYYIIDFDDATLLDTENNITYSPPSITSFKCRTSLFKIYHAKS